MEKEKIQCLNKTEGSVASSSDCSNLSNTIKDILMIDINYCKQRILESQQKLENIQSLLKLIRYSSVKEFYENKNTILSTVHGESLRGIDPQQHPTILAAQEQLFKLTTKRSTRQASKKPVSYAKNNKNHAKSKTNHSDLSKTKSKIKNIVNSENQAECTGDTKSEDTAHTLLNPNRSSRFFTKYKLLIGNTSQYIGDDNSDNCTHNWCIYVRRPEDQPSVSEILQKVRFHLDASYKPNDVVEVIGEPFSLNKRGWGEFPIKVEMFFKSNDKPVFFFHHLKLDKLKSGRYCLETETTVEVVLNINPNHVNDIPKKVIPEFKFKSLEENNVDNLASTNIKNIIEQNNFDLDLDIKSEFDDSVDSKDSIVNDIQTYNKNESEIEQYVVLTNNIVLHCVKDFDKSEYLVRLPKRIKVSNLNYSKTFEKCLFMNLLENKFTNEQSFIKKEEYLPNDTSPAVKRKSSDEISAIIPKMKSSYLSSFDDNSSKKLLNTVNIHVNNVPANHVTKSLKPMISENRSLLKKKSAISLLKSNNLHQVSYNKNLCDTIQHTKSLLSNKSLLCNNSNKKSNYILKPDPKIIILRKGNSVLTSQSPLSLPVNRVKLSPERKLLGGVKKNCENTIKTNVNNSKVFATFDKDVIAFKKVLNKLDIRQIIGYALRQVSLYADPDGSRRVFFDVPTHEEFKNSSLMKQIFLEIKRAKCISDFLKELYSPVPEGWNYVNILKYSRDYGFLPKEHKYWTIIKKSIESNSKEKIIPEQIVNKQDKKLNSYTNPYDLIEYFSKTLKSIPRDQQFNSETENVDIETISSPKKRIQKEVFTQNHTLPVLYGTSGECQFIIDSVKELGLSFQPELLLHGINHPSVLEVLCRVLKSFVSDLVRNSLGNCRVQGGDVILPEHIFATLLSTSNFDMLTNKNLGFKKE